MERYKDFAYIYDELIQGDVDYMQWSENILNICDLFNLNKSDYLDLACGTGNMTNYLSKKFKNTWAVDLSPDMLTEADKKLRSSGIKANLVCQDISSINLNRKFDLITCCLDSTNYITSTEDIVSYFKCVNNHLKDNGLFIFDINSYYKLTEILGNNTFNFDNGDVVYIWDNCIEDNIVDMYLTFFVKRGDMYERFDEEHRERAYTEKEIEEFLQSAGLEVLKKLNNYEDEKLTAESERIVYVVKKHSC
ncbi:MAG: class I SAM-dependent methyltransferase [Bacillota bacterium]|nr:class I SAM-dependent methyltransferase [Bacillota bacterium]